MAQNLQGATAYLDTIHNRSVSSFAHRLFAHYRDMGTQFDQGYPFGYESAVNHTTVLKIQHALRHYMVGDCDLRGVRIDPATGKRI